MRIALVNRSKAATDTDVANMAKLLNLQMTNDFCPAWDLAPTPVTFYPTHAAVPSGFDILSIMDECDDPQALGYHTEQGAVVSGLIGITPVLKSGGVMLWDADPTVPTVLSVASHEAMEMRNDPMVNHWVDGFMLAQGSQYSFEMSDPCESDSYELEVDGVKGLVSNFVLPDWFDTQKPSGSKYDFLGKLKAPFSMDAGGYMVVRAGTGNEQQVFGRHYPAWRWQMKQHAASRLARRGIT